MISRAGEVRAHQAAEHAVMLQQLVVSRLPALQELA